MNRTDKHDLVEKLRGEWAAARTAFLVEYRGLNVPQVTKLRDQVRTAKGRYRVVKNTLAARAMKGTSLQGLCDDLAGPLAIATTGDDSVALAKALVEFAKENPALVMKMGLVEGQRVRAEDVPKVATMPGRPELLGQVVGLLASPMRRLVTALQSPVQKLVSVLHQIEQQKEKAPAA